jgi:hypothetical protein
MRLPIGLRDPRFWTGIALAVGVALRLWHFCQDRPVWHDEAAVLVNSIQLSYRELLGPLLHHEAAPPGFLWLQRSIILTLGDEAWMVRLPSLAASLLGLVLFAQVANRWLPASAVPWAVVLFAVSDRFLWHTVEAKPYALDLFFAVLILWLDDRASTWSATSRCLLFTALAPILIWVSFPGCFLCGGLLLAMLPAVWKERRWHTVASYFLWAAVVAGAFLLLLGPIRAQRCAEMDSCWVKLFPDYSRPWSLPLWIVDSTGGVAHYAANPNGEYLAVLGLIGVLMLWRQGQFSRLVLLLVPIGLALLASLLGAYPYGSARVLVYAGPAVLLLVALGFSTVADRLWNRSRPAVALLSLFVLLPVANTANRLVQPWQRAEVDEAAEFVLRSHDAGDQVVCNGWEGEYYFRRPPTTVQFVRAGDPAVERPVWLVAVSAVPDERLALLRVHSQQRSVLTHREFAAVSVYRLSAHAAGR